jgi:hypothetical protein
LREDEMTQTQLAILIKEMFALYDSEGEPWRFDSYKELSRFVLDELHYQPKEGYNHDRPDLPSHDEEINSRDWPWSQKTKQKEDV